MIKMRQSRPDCDSVYSKGAYKTLAWDLQTSLCKYKQAYTKKLLFIGKTRKQFLGFTLFILIFSL